MIMSIKCSHRQVYQRPKVYRFEHRPAKFEYLDLVDSLDNGVTVKRLQYKFDDSASRYKGLTASDFELSNLLSAGVDLKHCQCRPTSIDMVDKFNQSSLALFDVLKSLNNDK